MTAEATDQLQGAEPVGAWAARFEALERRFQGPVAGGPRDTYSVAGRTIDVVPSSREAARWFGRPLRHLSGQAESGAHLEIRLGHGRDPELNALWNAPPRESARSWPRLALGDGRDVVGGLWPAAGMVGLLHRRRRKALLWIRDLERGSPADAATLFRAVVAWWLAGAEYTVVHAAAVAGSTGAALLLGHSGSGKSSTAAAGFEAGLSFMGDDSVLCRASTAEVFSLSGCAGLGARDVARHHPSLRASAALGAERGGKSFMDLASMGPDRVATRARLRALVRLTIDQGAVGALEPVPRSRVLTALAPSSIFNIPALDRRALSSMAALTRRLPAYELTLSGDRTEAAQFLLRLLEEGDS